jgi:hypothetical protein
VGARVLDWSRAQVAIMRPDPHARALNTIMRDLLAAPDGATYMAGRVWGVSTQYDLGHNHPLMGHRVPNFQFENNVTIGELMRDGHGVLLDFDGHASLKGWTAEYGGRIKYVSGRAKEQLGVNTVLIRPDGIVAWASDNDPDYSELQKFAARWFMTAFV